MTRRCRACGREIGGGRMGFASHAGKHYRDFKKHTGRDAKDWNEIIRFCSGVLGFFEIE